jgi:hypothetical protein
VGDADYSPLVQFANGKDALFNMPMVAFNASEDDLNKMCDGTVTLELTLGYTSGNLVTPPPRRPSRSYAPSWR